jgi:hypothetical protein
VPEPPRVEPAVTVAHAPETSVDSGLEEILINIILNKAQEVRIAITAYHDDRSELDAGGRWRDGRFDVDWRSIKRRSVDQAPWVKGVDRREWLL